jgi:hypothetical protein
MRARPASRSSTARILSQQLQACRPIFTAKNVPELHQWLIENA